MEHFSKLELIDIEGEVWAYISWINNFPTDSYLVSNLGRLKSVDRVTKGRYGSQKTKGRIKKQYKDRDGYLRVGLSYGSFTCQKVVSRLVATAFIPNPENKKFVCHKDDVPWNNVEDNLFWGTQEENEQDKTLKGRRPLGEILTHSKLTNEQVGEIKQIPLSIPSRVVASQYNVCRTTIKNIRSNFSWKHI